MFSEVDKEDVNNNKNGDDDDDNNNNNNENDDDVKVSWDSMEDDGEEETVMEEIEEEEEGDQAEDEGDDDEGIDDVAAKEYKPYKHRNLLSPVTNMEARIHLLNGCLGLGVIVLPSVMFRFGVIYATFVLILIGAIAAHGLHAFIKATYRVYCSHKVPQLAYPRCVAFAVQEACGFSPKYVPAITGFVTCLVFACHLSIASLYVKYIIMHIMETLKPLCEVCDQYEMIVHTLLIVPLLLVNSMPTIKDLVYCSLLGNLCSFVALGLIMHDAVSQLRYGQVDDYIQISEFPNFVGIALFATYTFGAILMLEGNMRKPKVLIGPRGIVNQIMVVVIITYIVFGFLGAVSTRGKIVKRSIIDRIPFATKLTYNATTILILVCFFSHPLVCYELFDILWRTRLRNYIQEAHHMKPCLIKLVIRTFIVVLTVSLAYVDVFDMPTVISLCGALLTSIVGVILPSLLHVLTSHHTRRNMYTDIMVILFGVLSFLGGIYELIKETKDMNGKQEI